MDPPRENGKAFSTPPCPLKAEPFNTDRRIGQPTLEPSACAARAPAAAHLPFCVSGADVRDAVTGLARGLARLAAAVAHALGALRASFTASERPGRNADHVGRDLPADAARARGVRVLTRLAIGKQGAAHAGLDVLAGAARTLEMSLARLTVCELRRAYALGRLGVVEAQSTSARFARMASRPVRAIIQTAPRAPGCGANQGIERAFVLAIIVRLAPVMAQARHRGAEVLVAARVTLFTEPDERNAYARLGPVPSAHSLATVTESTFVFDGMRARFAERARAEKDASQRIGFDAVELQRTKRLF